MKDLEIYRDRYIEWNGDYLEKNKTFIRGESFKKVLDNLSFNFIVYVFGFLIRHLVRD